VGRPTVYSVAEVCARNPCTGWRTPWDGEVAPSVPGGESRGQLACSPFLVRYCAAVNWGSSFRVPQSISECMPILWTLARVSQREH
jgi:hypothetical protein